MGNAAARYPVAPAVAGEHPVKLTPKSFELLRILLENQGRAMSKSELLDALWPDVEVEEGNLPFQISMLRNALGPEAGERPFRVTVTGGAPQSPGFPRRIPKRRRSRKHGSCWKAGVLRPSGQLPLQVAP
jgi:hypothetical protein